MAAYFSYLPNIYVGTGTTSSTKQEYQKIKNIFRRVKAREDLSKYTEFFEQYSIADGELPFQIAKEVYGDDELDWVVLLTNNIVEIKRCLKDWCLIKYNSHKAWILKSEIWGVYSSEIYNPSFFQPVIEIYWKLNKMKILFSSFLI